MSNNTNSSDEKVEDASTQSLSMNMDQRKTLIPLPACCDTKCWKISKYIYVIGVIIAGFVIVFLTQISDPIDDWFDTQQRIILQFLIDDSVFYIILVLLLITILKSMGVKDVLGLRTISVAVLAFRIIDTNQAFTLLLSMFIIGILSSISKLIEYQVIGHELQVVQGTPIEYIFKYVRKALLVCPCIEDESKLYWLDPKYTFDISEKSRDNRDMNVLENVRNVLEPYMCCNNNKNDKDKNDKDRTDNVNINRERDKENKPKFECTFHNVMCSSFYFIIAVIWTSVIEWVQPITELFLFAHNWSLTVINVVIIILSEFADFDKAVEAMFIIDGLYSDSDIIGAKVKAVASKGIFWALGYCIVAPPTLIWAYLYHKKYFPQDDNDNEQAEQQQQSQNDLEMQNNGQYDNKNSNKKKKKDANGTYNI